MLKNRFIKFNRAYGTSYYEHDQLHFKLNKNGLVVLP